MYNPDIMQESAGDVDPVDSALGNLINTILGIIPSYKDLFELLPEV